MCGDAHDDLDPELASSLREYFTESELADLVLVCGEANLNNRLSNAAAQLLGPGQED